MKKIASVLVIIGIIIIINKIIDKVIDQTIKRKDKKNVTTLLMFVKKIKRLILYTLMFILVLGQFEIFHKFSVTILSGLGIGSVVLGLAAQESLKDFFGSFTLVIGSPFEVGDFIECVGVGVSGTVEDITMRHTVIKTVHNRRVLIPNSVMNTYTIENFNYADNENMKLVDYKVTYETDIDKAMGIIKEEMEKLYHPNPKGKNKNVEFPKVRVYSWNDSSISLRAWVWGKDESEVFENVYKLNYIIKKRFEEEKIEVPYQKVIVKK